MYFREDIYIPDLCDLYDPAHAAGWEPYSLHDLTRIFCFGSVLHRSCYIYTPCTRSHNCRLISVNDLDDLDDLSVDHLSDLSDMSEVCSLSSIPGSQGLDGYILHNYTHDIWTNFLEIESDRSEQSLTRISSVDGFTCDAGAVRVLPRYEVRGIQQQQ